ncbi:EamA family transporter [uncultured Desulfovibrio sp.]|uniref:DMT family transporter n=1 Tax=uncultured Desulfovibrio sp. TaxID=167968 RepID=UPI0026021807|nr:EamA family transporter [uncultured Desulfovibrio sp.]
MRPADRLNGYVCILLAAFFWSLIGVISKICMNAGVSPLETAFWRAAFGGILFLLHAAMHRGRLFIRARDAGIFLLFGAWSVGVFFGATQYAIKLSGAAMSVVLLYTAPVWVAVFSRLLFRERISPRKLSAIGVALTGTTLVCFSGGSLPGQTSVPGIVCGMLTGICYASHYPFYRWWQSRYATATIYGFMLAGGVLTLWFCVPVSLDHDPRIWFWLAALGVTTTFFAYACYGQGLKRISLVRAAVTCHLEPVLSTLWVWLFWQENFSRAGWLGSGLVLAAVLLLTTDKNRD